MKYLFLVAVIFFQNAFSFQNLQLLKITVDKPYQKFVQLQRYERKDMHQEWQMVGKPFNVILGMRGTADQKKEGDKKTPLGTFSISQAFGRVKQTPLHMAYYRLTSFTRCIDDSQSANYNKIMETKSLHGERMNSYVQYRQGFVVDFNQEAIPQKGSCIFIHLIGTKTKKGTSGCIAISSKAMKELWQWLDKKKDPIITIEMKNLSPSEQKTRESNH